MAKRLLILTNSRSEAERSATRRQLTVDIPGVKWIENDEDVDAVLNAKLKKADTRVATIWVTGQCLHGPTDSKLQQLPFEFIGLGDGLIWLLM